MLFDGQMHSNSVKQPKNFPHPDLYRLATTYFPTRSLRRSSTPRKTPRIFNFDFFLHSVSDIFFFFVYNFKFLNLAFLPSKSFGYRFEIDFIMPKIVGRYQRAIDRRNRGATAGQRRTRRTKEGRGGGEKRSTTCLSTSLVLGRA